MDSRADGNKSYQYKMVKECEDIITCSICAEHFFDPRDLECNHTFCMECIKVYQRRKNINMPSECPVCKRCTVPPIAEMDRLLKNDFAVKLVEIVKENIVDPNDPVDDAEPAIQAGTQAGRWDHLPEPRRDPGEVMVGALQNLFDAQREATGMGVADTFQMMAALTGGTVNLPDISTGGGRPELRDDHILARFSGLLEGNSGTQLNSLLDANMQMMSTLFGIGNQQPSPGNSADGNYNHQQVEIETDDESMELMDDDLLFPTTQSRQKEVPWPNLGASDIFHANVKCDGCHTEPMKGARFKCGLCDDTNLCEDCFKRNLSPPGHSSWHYFILIQRPVNIAPGKLLNPLETRRMSLAIQPDDTFHKSVQCDFCQLGTGVRGIHGIRFKCGICGDFDLCQNCIANSAENHDSTHTFIVCRYYSNYGRHAAIQSRKLYY